MKTGLVMEGGAMRGLFTAGITDVFMENGITFDGAIGVSAGATFGCNVKSKQIGRSIRYNKKFCNDPRYGSFKSLVKTGDFFEEDFCYREIPFELDLFDTDTFRDNPMEFYVVATDVLSGGAVYHKLYDGLDNDLKLIQASASMPMVSKIVKVGDELLLDGGIADSIPIKYFNSIGYEKCVVILTQPYDYVKKPNKLVPVCKLMYRKYPKLVEAMANRHNVYNETLDYIKKLEYQGKILVLRPSQKLPVNHSEHDPEKLQLAYDIGRQEAIDNLEKVREFLK